MELKNIIVLGGDLRQYYMAELLAGEGFAIFYYGEMTAEMSQLEQVKIVNKEMLWKTMQEIKGDIVLPVPVSTDGIHIKGTAASLSIAEVAAHISGEHKVYGGNIPKTFRAEAGMKQGNLIDFMKSDRVAIRNAVATAEGVIAESIYAGKGILHGTKALVIGFGRCAEVLADKLCALHMEVTIMARAEKARIRAESYGYHAIDFDGEGGELEHYEYIYNTVPAVVIDEAFLRRMKQETIILDIASAPGGVDYEMASRLGIQAKLYPGLPGRFAPATSGKILAVEIMR